MDESAHRQTRLVTTDEGEFDERAARETALPVEDGEVVDTSSLDAHQEYVEGRGVYDERNGVNDLTGREWKVATKSVVAESYPPALGHELRSEHGGQKPPRLCRDLIERFSAAGDRVFDPFAGVGGTLLGASLAEREGTGRREALGIERVGRWIELYRQVLADENEARRDRGDPPLAEHPCWHGDCRERVADVATDSVDLLLTDVPYWDMDERDQTRNSNRTRESSLAAFDRPDGADAEADQSGRSTTDGVTDGEAGDVSNADDANDETSDADGATSAASGETGETGDAGGVSSSDDTDGEATTGGAIGGGSKESWLAATGAAFEQFRRVVAPDGYVAVFIGDMYRDGRYEPLSAELTLRLREVGYTMVANLIWYDPSKELHVYGYPHTYVPSMVHQNVLVFQP